MTIAPIGSMRQRRVVAATAEYVRRASEAFDRHLDTPPVAFDLTGRAAGMYLARGPRGVIRYNAYIFAKYFVDNLAVTVPHEVAHYVTDRLYGLRNVRPHGAEWRAVMGLFGADAVVTCRYDLDGIPVRSQTRYAYRCACSTHALSACRHHRARHNAMRYFCRRCGGPLEFSGPG